MPQNAYRLFTSTMESPENANHWRIQMQPHPIGAVFPPDLQAKLRQKAEELEAAFLSEMLAHAGLAPQEGSFSGGTGEEQFSSFLRDEQARLIVEKGGIGLAETLFRALVRAEEAPHAP